MIMKRVLALSLLGGLLLALPALQPAWGKAHVPTKKIQVCHRGEVISVSGKALNAFLDQGSCQLPACDFNNVFFTGGSCAAVDANGDFKCDLPNPREDAGGLTPGCPAGTF